MTEREELMLFIRILLASMTRAQVTAAREAHMRAKEILAERKAAEAPHA
jgi:hypothetical protein